MSGRTRRATIPPGAARGAALLLVAVLAITMTPTGPDRAAVAEEKPVAVWKPVQGAKPLSRNVKEGLAWLVAQQRDDGTWGAGEAYARRLSAPRRPPPSRWSMDLHTCRIVL